MLNSIQHPVKNTYWTLNQVQGDGGCVWMWIGVQAWYTSLHDWVETLVTDQRDVKRRLYRLEQIKVWQLVVLFVLASFVTATFLRIDNNGMRERRAAVIAADKAGDDNAIQNRLVDLQAYVIRHMNSSTGELDLVNKYNRDVEAASIAARSDTSDSNTIYRQADDYCRSILGGYSQTYVQCVYERIAQMPSVEDPSAEVQLPNPLLYRYNFASPLWTPGFSGWSMVVTAGIGLLIITRIIMYGVLWSLLRARYRRS